MKDPKRNDMTILDELWEKHKSKVERDHEGEYIAFDDAILDSSGLSMKDMKSAGNFKTWPTQPGVNSSYFLRGYGSGRSHLFKRFL